MSESTLVYTVNEAAEALHVHANSVYALCRDGRLSCIRVGRKVLIPKRAITRLLGEATDGQSEGASK